MNIPQASGLRHHHDRHQVDFFGTTAAHACGDTVDAVRGTSGDHYPFRCFGPPRAVTLSMVVRGTSGDLLDLQA